MAEISYSCDVTNGFNAQSDIQTKTGFLTHFKIGETEFETDISVTNPEEIEAKLPIVGVLSDVSWNGGEAEPLNFGCRVSTLNKNSAVMLTQSSMTNVDVEFTFLVFDYDPDEGITYQCFHCDEAVFTGKLQKEGGRINLWIEDSDPAGEVEAPMNWALSFSVVPPEPTDGQDIHFAASVAEKMVKQWGVMKA
jgi:hypothetical protein